MATRPEEQNALDELLERRAAERMLNNAHYPAFFTTHFGLTPEFYAGKRVLDIGCGPRGSLEWADMARERIGLDPLSETYLALGANKHKMTYVVGRVEDMSFSDEHFDVISSFYSLDHVNRLGARLMAIFLEPMLSQISRVLKPGGLLLLLTDLYDAPASGEPSAFASTLTQEIRRRFEILVEKHYEKKGYGIYDSVDQNLVGWIFSPPRKFLESCRGLVE